LLAFAKTAFYGASAEAKDLREWKRMLAKLRGLAWDHQRCWGPLDASVGAYLALEPAIEIAWDRRSLYEFGEGNLESAVRDYDLVIFDHPFVGDVARDRLMVPFDLYLTQDANRRFAADAVGASWRSYQSEGQQWALPIDAAAQVACCRPDLLERYGGDMPASHDAALALGRRLRADGKWLGLPLVPTDALCLLLSFAAGAGDTVGAEGGFLPHDAVTRAIDELRALAALAHPLSKTWNPIRCYDHMIAHDDVVYVPYAFGYVNYAARGEPPYLRFADIPRTPPRGALLGGAGIGVSAFTMHRRAAIDYALFLCAPDFQREEYVAHGGQPGSLAAWTDTAANARTHNFFRDTLATLQGAYLRPTHAGVLAFFRAATHYVSAAIAGDRTPAELADWLDRHYADTVELR
jgi:multiple sugar transport system substrate-binding protein